MKFIIDRFEGDIAILVNDITLNLPRSILPEEAREGDVISIEIKIDREETERLRKEVEDKLKSLKDREEKGDIWL
ncbi:MAG: DUF3006 domain-containing protein [Dictyoglomi bacterium]|jgi:hypothetical protein|nr:DUF3006 domain-containing protein [Dictyoglomota bacterium]HOL55499.1 DUF3006 domain-containing protein [bacterium]HPC77703.1 DUF3006 domain-containing protein [bacterium]HPO82959.1 DUF3006 domain-containing protein [bacterium]